MPHLDRIVWSPDENAKTADADDSGSIHISITTSRNVSRLLSSHFEIAPHSRHEDEDKFAFVDLT